MIVPALFFDDFLQHVGRRASRHILIQEQDAVGLLERPDDPAVDIERQQGLYIHNFDFDAGF